MRQKSGSGSFVAVVIVRCCIKNLSFSVNALAQSRPDQRGSGDFPKTAVKIALSKSIISATVGEAGGSGSYKSREEPQFQQDASCNDLSLTAGIELYLNRRTQSFTALKSWTGNVFTAFNS